LQNVFEMYMYLYLFQSNTKYNIVTKAENICDFLGKNG